MGKKQMITTTQFANATGLPYTTVVRWAQTGIIPGVEKEETPRGPVWLIPQTSLDKLEEWKPKRGRPKVEKGKRK
jgi:hypothetical protein